MIRVAFPLIGGQGWTGGYNYLLNLIRVVQTWRPGVITPVVLFGQDTSEEMRKPFVEIPGVEVAADAVFAEAGKTRRIALALTTGLDAGAARVFGEHRIDLVFEAAQFYGWRLAVPAIAWIPDFQHRYLARHFSPLAQAKRAVGFNAQMLGGRTVMLSSEDARRDCERFHRLSRGRTAVVPFATPRTAPVDAMEARAAADRYGLPATFYFLPNQFWLHKNHAVVVEALGRLKAEGRPVVVAASGGQRDPRDPEHFGRLMMRVAELGVTEQFRPLGLIPYEDIPQLMRASAALLNPSLFEGWSTTVEEAKAIGAPMILSDLRVHREQTEGLEVRFFDPHHPGALATALSEHRALGATERQARAEAAAARSQVDAEVFAQRFVTLVQQCVAARR